ncbi:unnamed protein product [Natator depressus]
MPLPSPLNQPASLMLSSSHTSPHLRVLYCCSSLQHLGTFHVKSVAKSLVNFMESPVLLSMLNQSELVHRPVDATCPAPGCTADFLCCLVGFVFLGSFTWFLLLSFLALVSRTGIGSSDGKGEHRSKAESPSLSQELLGTSAFWADPSHRCPSLAPPS